MERFEYLERKIEPRFTRQEKQTYEEAAKALETSFGDVEWQDADTLSLEKSGARLNLKYEASPVGDEWRKLLSLSLESKREEESHLIDILSEVQPAALVSYKIRNFKEKGLMRTDGKEVRLFADITTPKGLIILLHEIGHDVYRSHKEAQGDIQQDASFLEIITASSFSNKDKLAESLRAERYASAYALKKLRPFIGFDSFPKSGVLKFIHHENLNNLSQYLRGATEGAVKAILKDTGYYLKDLVDGRAA